MPDEWFLIENGQQVGPVSEADLKARVAAGTLRPETMIWNESMPQWRAAGEITDWTFNKAPAQGAPSNPASSPGATAAAPPVALAYVSHHGELPVLSQRVIDLLKWTRPWLRMFAILGYILGGLMVLGGIIMVMMMSWTSRPNGVPAFVGLIYAFVGAIYIVPALYLSRCASRITRLERMHRTEDLEAALAAQHAFWRFCGILFLVVLALYLGGIAIAVGFHMV